MSSDPTKTLQQLRRAICKELRMPFFRRYKNGFLDADGGGSTVTLIDAALTQPDGFWSHSWFYNVSTQEASLVTKFDAKTDTCYLETPVTIIAAGDDYELQSLWNAYEIHDAINQAIREVQRIYVSTNMDDSIIVQESVLSYDLTALTPDPFLVRKVWLEPITNVRRGVVVSAGADTVTLENTAALANVNSEWLISIYAGTGKGQQRGIVTVAGASITDLSTSWTTQPNTTSKYALWNPLAQVHDWIPYSAFRTSDKEFPNTLYLNHRMSSHVGLRIRIQYSSLISELALETDTTIVPASFLVPAAISYLHGQYIGDNRSDRELHFGEARRYRELAESFLARNLPDEPDFSVKSNPEGRLQPNAENPLNWDM